MKDPLEDVQLTETRHGSLAVLLGLLALLGVLFVRAPWVAAIIVGLIVMVMLHEAGHLLAARWAGMKATEYFLGFGPRLWSIRRGETEYGVKPIWLGGYVRIIGMSNLEKVAADDEPRSFRRGTTGKRLVVVLAGVTVNALLAFVLFFVVIAGQGRVSEGVGTTISRVVSGSAAQAAGLRHGDRIVAIDGSHVDSWTELKRAIEAHGGEQTTLTVVRDGERTTITATPRIEHGQGFLGISPAVRYREVGVLEAIPESFRSMGDMTVGTVEALGRLVSPSGVERYSRNFTSSAPRGSTPDLERPRTIVGIVDQGSQLVAGNIWALFWLLGGISLLLAIFNLIPLLPFDGGHAAIVVYEGVAGRVKGREVRVDFRKLMPVTAVVLAIFLTLGLSALFLDVRDIVR